MDDFSEFVLPMILIFVLVFALMAWGFSFGTEYACETIAKDLGVDYFIRNQECLLEVNGTFVRLIDLIKIPS